MISGEDIGWCFRIPGFCTGTVRENIAYGKPDATEEEVIEAAKAAHADSFIHRLPKGYDTMITGSGGNLSAGQRQLLCIASHAVFANDADSGSNNIFH